MDDNSLSNSKSINPIETEIHEQLFQALSKSRPVSTDLSPAFLNRFDDSNEEIEKIYKLEEILANPAYFHEKKISLRRAIRKSIKNNYNLSLDFKKRKKLWMLLINQAKEKNEKNYNDMVNFSGNNYPDHYFKMIELDVHRTWLNLNISESENNILITKLRNILNAYAVRNPYIGYCQGFNFIVGEFLTTMDFEEYEIFSILIYVMEVLLPLDYYTSMIGLMVKQRIFLEFLKIECPEIVEKFRSFNIDCSFFTLQWFVCLFSSNTHKEIFKVIWDHLFAFDSNFLFKIGLALLDLTKNQWLNAADFPELLLKLEESIKKFSDTSAFQKKLHEKYLNKRIISSVSEKLRSSFKSNIKEKGKKISSRLPVNFSRLISCDDRSPLCWDLIEKMRLKKRAVSFFIFRQAEKPSVISDYFQNKNNEEILKVDEKKIEFCEENLKENSLKQNSLKQSENGSCGKEERGSALRLKEPKIIEIETVTLHKKSFDEELNILEKKFHSLEEKHDVNNLYGEKDSFFMEAEANSPLKQPMTTLSLPQNKESLKRKKSRSFIESSKDFHFKMKSNRSITEGQINKNSLLPQIDYASLVIGRHHHICTGKYVKTKTKAPTSFVKEIEMREMSPGSNDVFIIEKSPILHHYQALPNENFFDKIMKKIGGIFSVLCVRDSKDSAKNTLKGVESRKIPVIDFSSDFNMSFLNNSGRKSYEEGVILVRNNQIIAKKGVDVEEELRFKDMHIEEIDNVEILNNSRTYSFNSSFRKYTSMG